MTFHYVPSALHPPQHGGVGIYVRYVRNRTDRISILAEGVNHQLIRTPDRDLLLVKNLHAVDSYRPLNEHWDELLVLSPHSPMWRDIEIEMLMTNYVSHQAHPEESMMQCQLGRHKPDGVTWMADGGGFQFASGKASFIDPVKLAHWYNGNTHIGVALDIPVGDYPDLYERSARIQRQNNDIMLDIIRPPAHLMNVVHGLNIPDYDRFHEMVHDERFKHLAISDIYRGSSIEGLGKLFHIFDNWRPYQQYHILGIFNLRILFHVIRAATTLYADKLLTTDTSTALQKSITWNYYFQRGLDYPLQQQYIGIGATPYVTSSTSLRTLPCSCPVCSRIRYADILGRMAKTSQYLLSYHNLIEIVRYTKLIQDLSRSMDDKQFLDLTKAHLRNFRNFKEIEHGLHFIQECRESGLLKARSKHTYWFTSHLASGLEQDDVFIDSDTQEMIKFGRDNVIRVLDAFEARKDIQDLIKHKKRKNFSFTLKQRDTGTLKSTKRKGKRASQP